MPGGGGTAFRSGRRYERRAPPPSRPAPRAAGADERDGDAFSVVRVPVSFPNVRWWARSRGPEGRGLDGEWNRTYAVDWTGEDRERPHPSPPSCHHRHPRTGTGGTHAFHLGSVYESRELRSWPHTGKEGGGLQPRGGIREPKGLTAPGRLRHDLPPAPRPSPGSGNCGPTSRNNTFRNLDTGFEQSARVHVDVH